MIAERAVTLLVAVAAVATLGSRAAAEEATSRGDVHAGAQLYTQPAPSDWLVVFTPTVTGRVNARRWLSFDVSWNADVVTGATRRTYGTPDVVTAATRFTEVRNVLGAAAEVRVKSLALDAGYIYGTESDYRSQLVHAGGKLDLFQHNTILAGSYSHSFDRICDLDQPGVPVTLRQPLDTSHGCFAGVRGLTEEPLDVDAVELSMVQTLTPKLVASLVGSYQHSGGFQSNPYRRVRLSGGLFQAQESHPRVRDRGAATARVRLAIEKLEASVAFDLRLYRDTWGIDSLTVEAGWEQPFRRGQKAWRFSARARGYVQSGAVFYRDAGNADSYERTGPVGDFFTADQALAPLADLLLGGRVIYALERPAAARLWRAFTNLETTLLLEYVKIFPLSPEPPNAARARFGIGALVVGASASGRF